MLIFFNTFNTFPLIEEDEQGVQLIKEEPKKLYRAKFFKFSENRRPPFYVTNKKTNNKSENYFIGISLTEE